jgi:hypothetical protein
VQPHGQGIDDLDLADDAQRLFLDIGRGRGDGALQAELDDAGVERRPVLEAHAVAQVEGVGQAVGRDPPNRWPAAA